MKDTPYWVEVGDEHRAKFRGVCSGVVLVIQGISIVQDFFLLGLGGVDVVLGLEWLAGLGEIRANVEELTLKIKVGNQKLTLKGEPEMIKKNASLTSLLKALQ